MESSRYITRYFTNVDANMTKNMEFCSLPEQLQLVIIIIRSNDIYIMHSNIS